MNYYYKELMLRVTGFLDLPLIKDFTPEALLNNELLHQRFNKSFKDLREVNKTSYIIKYLIYNKFLTKFTHN